MIAHVNSLMVETPTWAVAAVIALSISFVIFQVGISYTWGSVVATLAMVESPNTTAIIQSSPADDGEVDATLPSYSDSVDSIDDKKPLLVEQEVMLVTPKPITASVRGTVRHLRAETGNRLSHYRGAGVAILAGVLSHIAHYLIMGVFPFLPAVRLLSFIFVQIALCRITMLWTHVVISKPSSKPWYRRIAPRSSAKKIALPTMVYALAQIATAVVPVMVFYIVDCEKYTTKNIHDLTCRQRLALALKLFTVMASCLLTIVFVLIPVQVSLTRCQAALLSEEETPIVPFDRTFGGRLALQSEGGSGRLLMKEAWRSFDWNARVRLAKVWAKTLGMQVGGFLVYLASMALVATVAAMTKH